MVRKIAEHKNFIKALGMSLIPLLAGIIFCLADGKTLLQVFLPASVWNDELFYYKQVEAVVNCGIPQGFFGFNESTARYISFAAWSPAVLVPYILWGFLFGWNLFSPILCNIFLSMLAMFFFVHLLKPEKKQCIALAVLYLASLFTTRYMLSGMSETICSFWAVLYLGLAFGYQKEEKKSRLVLLFLVVGMMTLIRPYYLILILLPAYYSIKKYRLWAVFVSLGAFCGFSVLYFILSKNFCAPYFSDLFSTVWLENYKITGLFGGLRDTFLILWDKSKEFLKLILVDIRGNADAVGLIGQFAVIVFALICQTVIEAVSKKKEKACLCGYFAGSFLVILAAFFLMYHMLAGNRHLLVFITMGIFFLSYMEDKYFVRTVFTSLALLFFFFRVPAESEQKKLFYKEPAIEAELSVWQEIMNTQICMSKTDVPNWDNVIIWALSDVTDEENPNEHEITKWQLLYAAPPGMGINCCLQSYVLNSFDTLQGKYLAVLPDGQIDRLCAEAGKTEIGRTQNLVLYELR